MSVSPRILLVVASLILSVAIGFSLAGRGGTKVGDVAADADQVVIGLSMDTLKEARWQRDRDVFVERAEKLGAKVLVQSANSDDTRQLQDVTSLLTQDVDILVVVPHDGAAMAKAVDLAHQQGIPTLAYDRLITGCDLDLYMSFDNEVVGERQAEYLVGKLPGGKGRIVRIYGAPTDNNAKLFKKGQDNVLLPLVERGDIEVLHEDWTTDWDPANAKKIMNAALTSHGDKVDAVLASNDGTAGGAIQALKEAGLVGKTIVTGQDAELVACQRIAAGTQAMTIYKPVQNLAAAAAEVAVNMAKGKPVVASKTVDNGFKPVPSVLLEVTTVDASNLRETVIKDGFHKEGDVFAGEAKQ